MVNTKRRVTERKHYRSFFVIVFLQLLLSQSYGSTPEAGQVKYGSIRVTSDPYGADIYLDEIITGQKTPATLRNVTSGRHSITVKMDLYSDETRMIEVKNGVETTVPFDLSPNFQKVELNTDEYASVFIDDAKAGTGKVIARLSYGTHKIRIERENFKTKDTLISIVKGRETRLPFFKLIPRTGTLFIRCEPAPSEITIDGSVYSRNQVNTTIKDISIGEHTVTLNKPGHRSIVKKIIINEGETISLDENLIAGGIALTFRSNPDGAEVYIDNTLVGKTPIGKIVSPGSHDILLMKDIYEDYKETIAIQSDKVFDITLTLKTRPVTITTFPRKSVCIVEGKSYNLPLTKSGIPLTIGNHKLRFEKDKYNTLEKEILVGDNEKNINVLLYPQKFRNKGTASLLSLIWPGAGQTYLNRGKSAHFILGFIGYGLVAASYLQYDKTLDIYNDYKLETESITRREELKDQWKSSEKNWQNLAYAAGGVWGINMLWTLLSNSEEKKYDKLKVKFDYNNQTQTSLLGITRKF